MFSRLRRRWCTIEPRSFQAYSCRSCGCLVGAGSPHGCRGALYRTGPDLQVFWPEGATIYDATVAHVTAASYSHRSVSSIVEEKIREKVEFYSPMMQQGDEFEVLLFYSLGGLHPSVLKLLARLVACSDGRLTLPDCLDQVSTSLHRFTGETLRLASLRGRME